MDMSDTCIFLHEDYCIFEKYCAHQIRIIQDGEVQSFPGCKATTDDLIEGDFDE